MKKNRTKLHLLEGALAGAALGAAAALMLAPKSGKSLRKDMQKKSAEFSAFLATKLKAMKKMGEEDYKMAVHKAMEAYSKAKKLSNADANTLAKEAQTHWKHFKKHFA